MEPFTPLGAAFICLAMMALLIVPRRWAPLPMLLVTCYMTPGVGVMLGQFSFFSIRLIILAGLIRVLLRGEYHSLISRPLDRVMVVWSIWALAVSIFRSDPGATFIGNGGFVFNFFGIYILLRSWCRSLVDVFFLCRITAWLLMPIALCMVYEKVAASNLFSHLGGVPELPEIRLGRIRAQGPFVHSIMAGSVGAAMLPLCLGLWSRFRGAALVGTMSAITMVFASSSSGPLLSSLLGLLGLLLWKTRSQVRTLRWAAISVFALLMVVMDGRAYYLIERIDLAGGSASWHRARLIDMSLEHLGEWWLAGTDYTRHWMPTGVPWSQNHTDITNQYILFGVQGGLPLMALFILLLAMGFSIVGRYSRGAQAINSDCAFFCWALGSSLFAQAATFISVAYIDQSFVFLFITLASIAGLSNPSYKKPANKWDHSTQSCAVFHVYRPPASPHH
jgi:hypothetical protein